MIDLRANGLSEELVHFPAPNPIYNERNYLCKLLKDQNIEYFTYTTNPVTLERLRTQRPEIYQEQMNIPGRLSTQEAALKVRKYVRFDCYPTVIVSHVPYATMQQAMESLLFEPRDSEFREAALLSSNQYLDEYTDEVITPPREKWNTQLQECKRPWDNSEGDTIWR